MEGEIMPGLSTEEHLEAIRSAAAQFLEVIGAAGEAGVSQALILPMLVEQLRASGIQLDPRAMMGLG